MQQRVRRKQYDADDLYGSTPSPFRQADQAEPELGSHRPNPLIQTKQSPTLPQPPRRFDQIPLFPERNPSSDPHGQGETSEVPQVSPVQRLVLQRLKKQEHHRSQSAGRPVNKGCSSLQFKQAIALQSKPHARQHAPESPQSSPTSGVQRWTDTLGDRHSEKPPSGQNTSSLSSQNRSIYHQPKANHLSAHQLKGVANPGNLTLQAKDVANRSNLEDNQHPKTEGYRLQLKAIAHPPLIQRDQEKDAQDMAGNSDTSSQSMAATNAVPTFTRESSLSSVDDDNHISFVPVSVDIDDDQSDMDDYSSAPDGSIANGSTANQSVSNQSSTADLDMTTLSTDQRNAHIGNATNGQGQTPNQSAGNVNFVGQGNSKSTPKQSLWERFKKKMRGEKVNAARNTPFAANQSFHIGEGVTALKKMEAASDHVNIAADGSWMGIAMSQALDTILSTTWCSLCLAGNLVKAFHYQKRRKDGYKKSWISTGFKEDKEGNVLAPLPESEYQDEIDLGRVAKYAYNKTNRAFVNTMIKCVLQIIRLIAYLITALSGGTTAVVTGAIALGSRITESMMALGRKAKGAWKLFKGTKGKNRKKHADELLRLAKIGNLQAAQTIMDVDPFEGLLTKATSGSANKFTKTFGMGISKTLIGKGNKWKNLSLPRPANADDLIQQLQKGGMYGTEKRDDPEGKARLGRLGEMLANPSTKDKWSQLTKNYEQADYPGKDVLLRKAKQGQKEPAQLIVKLWDKTWSTPYTSMPKPTGWKHLVHELQEGGLYSKTDSFPPVRRRKLANALKRSMLSQ